jgi:hypothetical protein
MKKLGVFVLAVIILTATMGCSGQMDGVIQSDAGRIEIMYTDSRVAVAELITVLHNGERFRGKPERLDRTKEMMEAESTDTDDISIHFEALQTFPGNVKATLSGNRDNIIKCRFKLTDVIIGFSSGGFGICQVSDGRVIDVFF